MSNPRRKLRSTALRLAAAVLTVTLSFAAAAAPPADAAAASWFGRSAPVSAAVTSGTSLEQAASKAGNTGRQVAMSLIGLAFAVAAIVLSFRRDFKEAAGVFAVGIVAVLLATPAGVALLRNTVTALFGSA